ncbi:hypothetical protein QBC46DRAFT_295369 [Diplogelasinospora grovesii]|uniref:Uncharacterized protein n=1 Tax=Diplogelasinospora grovesii TaxID=303347 RepID=A0AAN6N2A5_9PEZI|nr:hypothetical protein QBC46DRAFT_295369 [Diplogelasinospora grovesii]
MADSVPIASLKSLELDLPPSCVEFCSAHPSYFLVGTYNLQKGEADASASSADASEDEEVSEAAASKTAQSRDGSIIVFRLSDDTLERVQTVPQPSALLDLHFNPNAGKQDICGVVSSTATLAIFKLSPHESQPLKHLNTFALETAAEGEVLFLSLCWHPTIDNMVAITTSTGHVHLVSLGASYESWEFQEQPALTHTLETWTCAISPPMPSEEPGQVGNTFLLYSGGDDSALRCKMFSCDRSDGESGKLVVDLDYLDRKLSSHDAGVTAILPLPGLNGETVPTLVVTGSYDDHIRLFQMPTAVLTGGPGRPEKLAEENLGGGVWRLKLIDLDGVPTPDRAWRARLLVSCMHAGARVVDLIEAPDGECRFEVIGRFEEHKSMNYGSDFQPGPGDGLTIISTSFYDKLLCLWKLGNQ